MPFPADRERDRPWVMRTYAGHSSAAASNALYRKNLEKGQTGLSVAFDLPTQTGYDPDHPLARGEVGKVGVPIAHIGDMRQLFDGIPLAEANTSMTINAPAMWLLALYVTVAKEQAAESGQDPDEVLAKLAELGLDPANRNGAGQVVAAGPQAALAELAAAPPERARVIPLPVAGAFHTRFMAPAEEAMRAHAEKVTPADPVRPLLSNADGAVVTDGGEALRRLVAQVTRPVRWDACMARLRELGVTAVIELPPAGTLVGLVKRDLKGTATLALKTPDDLDKAVDLITEHAGADT